MREWADELRLARMDVGQLLGAAGGAARARRRRERHPRRSPALRADLLRLELTETALLRVGHSAAVELEAIRDLGVRIGMDDFGTGYASLTNLQQLPIDFLKIDRSFVITLKRGVNASDHGNAIVAAIAHIGQTLDLETIAEGIETEEQAELLRDHGCPYGQGFHFARPAPADEIATLLTGRNHLPTRKAGTASTARQNGQTHADSGAQWG